MQSSPRGKTESLDYPAAQVLSGLWALDCAMSLLLRAWIYSLNKCPITVGFVHVYFRRRVGLLIWLIYSPPSFLKIIVYACQICFRAYRWQIGDTCGVPLHPVLPFPELTKCKQFFMKTVIARKFWCRLFQIFHVRVSHPSSRIWGQNCRYLQV